MAAHAALQNVDYTALDNAELHIETSRYIPRRAAHIALRQSEKDLVTLRYCIAWSNVTHCFRGRRLSIAEVIAGMRREYEEEKSTGGRIQGICDSECGVDDVCGTLDGHYSSERRMADESHM
ncbi:hypothetical protein Tco_0703355 [Tanacetum coccineum]|uniref:Uncharacterized protein n=1 Tax=Tanacetum coccineum TaxID=301880 RepID=A0ABQ4XYN9_9ASTR